MLPINLNLRGKLTLVVGGGSIAAQKIRRLRKTATEIRVVAPRIRPEILRHRDLQIRKRAFRATDLTGVFFGRRRDSRCATQRTHRADRAAAKNFGECRGRTAPKRCLIRSGICARRFDDRRFDARRKPPTRPNHSHGIGKKIRSTVRDVTQIFARCPRRAENETAHARATQKLFGSAI